MIKRIVDFIKKKPGLSILLLILSVITVANIKPDFYLMGWDNYSSYFNLKTNIFRTSFATWREYRGLGVPSDAEVTDIFRQVFYWFAHFLLPEQLLDQVYYMIALWVGVLSMYGLIKILFSKEKNIDLFATIASLFYLFNLNTLSVFYSPIIPFTNRFYSLPLLIYFFLRYHQKKTKKNLFFLIFVVFLASGSYITPTVIITTIIALWFFLFFWLDFKKSLVYLTIYLLLNSFWLLPFLNYTIQKSSIVPLARTFIEINESTLNRGPEAFSLYKQLILFPSFFDMNFSSITGKKFTIHPQLYDFTRSPTRFILFLFPILYCFGSLLIVLRWRKNKRILWIPIWIFTFLFLSMKEYGLFGFVYQWLEKVIPFFKVIFRISDTKFHAYISFAGSIAVAYAIFSLYRYQKIIIKAITVLVLIYIFSFRSYFNGNLIGFFSYTKVPQAYFDIANIINKDPEKNRVLHLPIDQWQHYWRSFSWGYLGSSFLSFLLNKPYIDKTFEPASLENTYLHARINNLLDSFYRTTDVNQKDEKAEEFIKLLRKTGVRYVIIDQSISAEIYTRNLVYTARQSYIKSKEIMEYLSQKNKVSLLRYYKIDLQSIYSDYRKLYPVTKIGLPTDFPLKYNLYLYKVEFIRPIFSLVKTSRNVDSGLANLLETNIGSINNQIIIQDPEEPAELIPFKQQNHIISKNNKSFFLKYENPNKQPLLYQVSTSLNSLESYMIDIFGRIKDGSLNLTFYHRYYPDINGQQFKQYVGEISFNLNQNIENYRLKLNDIFIDFPSIINQNDTYITSYIIHEKKIKIALLSKKSEKAIDLRSFSKTSPTSCYGPQDESYRENVEINNSIRLKSVGGSICVSSPIPLIDSQDKNQYIEVELLAKGDFHGYVCINESHVSGCLNSKKHIRLTDNFSNYRFILNSYVNGSSNLNFQIGLIPQQELEQSMEIEKTRIHVYLPIEEKQISFNPIFPQEKVNISGPLVISFPQAKSLYSYYHDPSTELFDLSQNPCRGNKKNIRVLRFKNGLLYNEMENCDIYFAQNFKYVFGFPYLFAYQYILESGQQPNILLGREGDNYLLEKASLYQGYPNLKGRLVYASRLFEPSFLSDSFFKDVSIHITQDTANKGLLLVGAFDIMEYPITWYNLTLIPNESEKTYSSVSDIHYQQILPSLWKVTIDNSASNNLLIFNEGYDKQWGIYENTFDLIFGKSRAKSIRCDGYANCFEIPYSNFYVFYWPEKLYLFGWIVTFFTVIFSFKFAKK